MVGERRSRRQGDSTATAKASNGRTLPLATKLGRDVAKQRHDDNNRHRYVEFEVKPQIPLL